MKRILTLTMNPAIDLGSAVDEIVSEKKLRCEKPTIEAGGGGINVARALRRLDVDSNAVFPSGGLFGKCHQGMLEAEGIECLTFETEAGMQRINNNIRETSKNRQYRFCVPGAAMREDEWKRVLDIMAGLVDEGTLFVVSGSLPPGVPGDFNARIARKVADAGGMLILDESADFLESLGDTPLAWITPNHHEFENIIGRSIEPLDLEKELEAFVRDGPVENVLLTMGGEGARYAGAEGSFHIAAPEVEKVSAVGAGDCTVAGLAYALAQGLSHREALVWAIAAGSAAVMTPASNLLKKSDFEKLRESIAEDA